MCFFQHKCWQGVLHTSQLNKTIKCFLITYINVENYMISYKLYSLVITTFDFMHATSMYVIYILGNNRPTIVYYEKLDLKRCQA